MLKIDQKLEDVNILNTGNLFGNMNTTSRFYPNEMTLDEIRIDFLKRRLVLAKNRGFDGHKMFMASQNKQDGSYCVLTRDLIARKEDGWLNNIPEDILIITKDTPGVVIGHPVADCPVIIMTDKKNEAVALGHCSGSMVDKLLPIKIVESLEKEFASKKEDIKVYVSSCIGKDWEYDCWPSFATNKDLWKNSILVDRVENGTTYYHINIRQAISEQLAACGIKRENIYWNMDDTLKDDNYYSNSAARINPEKAGRNFVGAYYEDKQLIKK